MRKVFVIHDTKADTFAMPMFELNNATMFRAIEQLFQSPQENPYKLFPADYTLFAIGEYDEQLGEFQPFEKKENLGQLSQFIKDE